jgi:allophanate hydrolase subunit 2
VLGSRSTDLLSDLGPARLRPGDRLPIGSSELPPPDTDLVPPPDRRTLPITVDLEPGPRSDWFTDDAHASLLTQTWTVNSDSDRTAVRLDGARLKRKITAELPSEGLIRGAVQVPPSGLPLVFGSNHPVTGGYPVIAVVDDAGCDLLAQLRPGEELRFRRRRKL